MKYDLICRSVWPRYRPGGHAVAPIGRARGQDGAGGRGGVRAARGADGGALLVLAEARADPCSHALAAARARYRLPTSAQRLLRRDAGPPTCCCPSHRSRATRRARCAAAALTCPKMFLQHFL